MDERTKDDVENLEVEVLNDADLESVSGGANNIFSTTKNACCPSSDAPAPAEVPHQVPIDTRQA